MQLRLHKQRYPQWNVEAMAVQLEVLPKVKEKMPQWYANPYVFYPSALSVEQCSSQWSAQYKASLSAGSLIDLTGGLGVDSYYFHKNNCRVTYVEQQPQLCAAARNNFKALEAESIEVVCATAQETLEKCAAQGLRYDLVYVDAARRGAEQQRVFALEDCQPNVLELMPALQRVARRILLKVSPMADITQILRLLPQTVQVHVVAVKNECKELLFLLHPAVTEQNTAFLGPLITCVDLVPEAPTRSFRFYRIDEEAAAAQPLPTAPLLPGNFLFDASAALRKAGAFALPALRYGLCKLHTNSHLYVSANKVADFPGRRFRIEQVVPFSSAWAKTVGRTVDKANVVVRNFPLTVQELRRKTGLKEGGDLYIFATTKLPDNEKVIIYCSRLDAAGGM